MEQRLLGPVGIQHQKKLVLKTAPLVNQQAAQFFDVQIFGRFTLRTRLRAIMIRLNYPKVIGEGNRMSSQTENQAVRAVLQKFQDGYTIRDKSKLDEFMQLFAPTDQIELIGVGAFERGGREWFNGRAAIREIIAGDWTYWGVIDIDVEGAKITISGETAWFSTTGTLTSGDEYEKAYPFYLEQMRDLLMDEKKSFDERLTNATHFGVNRLRDRMRGAGTKWPFVITAVLVKTDGKWGFHTIHWSFPAE